MSYSNYNTRRKHLTILQQVVTMMQEKMMDALYTDLRKARQEAYMCEVGLLMSDIRYQKRHLRRWMRSERKGVPLTSFPARCRVIREPYGRVLVIAPWNYPMLLSLQPAVHALAAGNSVTIKPSEMAMTSAGVVAEVVQEYKQRVEKEELEPMLEVEIGGVETSKKLLEKEWGYIFYTGNPSVGRIVLQAASRYLTPVTLELGGKSPVIVDRTANMDVAARRVVFGKFLNSGQTCVAPDYLLVEEAVCGEFINLLQSQIDKQYGWKPFAIVNERHFDRIMKMIEGETVIGGRGDREALQIDGSLITLPTLAYEEQKMGWNVDEHKVMQEEIFGPVLPIIPYKSIDEALKYVGMHPKPLALYLLSSDKKCQERVVKETSSGGVCINDTIMHLAQSNSPFGGVGDSGMGQYHGKYSYETFTHPKTILTRGTWLDMKMRYAPYSDVSMRLVRHFLK